MRRGWTTSVEDISELEEAKPEAKPSRKSKTKTADMYELGEAAEENAPRLDEKPGKPRRAKTETYPSGTRAGRRPPEDMSDIAAASTTASSDSGQRYSDASSSVPSMPP